MDKHLIIPDKVESLTDKEFYDIYRQFIEANPLSQYNNSQFETFILLHSKKFKLTVAEYSPHILFIIVNGILYRLFRINHQWYCEAYIKQPETVAYVTRWIGNLDNFISFIINTSIRYNKS